MVAEAQRQAKQGIEKCTCLHLGPRVGVCLRFGSWQCTDLPKNASVSVPAIHLLQACLQVCVVERLVVLVVEGIFYDSGGKHIGALSRHAIQRFVGFNLSAPHTLLIPCWADSRGGTGGGAEGRG